MSRWIVLVALLFASGPGSGQESEEVRLVRAFAKQIGIPISGGVTRRLGVLKNTDDPVNRITLEFGSHHFMVNLTDKRVDSYQNNRFRDRSIMAIPPSSFVKTEEEWWVLAERVLARASFGVEFKRVVLKGHKLGPGANRAGVFLSFEEQPFGVPTGGYGNTASLWFDRESGQLISVHASLGTILLPPNVRISEKRAIELALARQREFNAKYSAKVEWVRLGYAQPGGLFSASRGAQLRAQRKYPYAYTVVFSQASFVVDASTGEILGGGLRSPERPKTPAKP